MKHGFKLFNSDMKELEFPEGVLPLDFLTSSIEKNRYAEEIKGIPGLIDYGFDYKNRSDCSMTFFLSHRYGDFDYQLMVSELNALLDSEPFFYITRNTLPSRMLKITVDSAYEPERLEGGHFANLEVSVNVSGLPFWRTKYTTQEIESSGYSGLVEKYGTADGIHVDYLKYTFTGTTFKVWNGGNVTVDPRNMMLNIRLYRLVTDGGFTMTNKTTGEVFKYTAPRTGNTVDLNGVKVLMGLSQNKLRETNRKFISLVPGENEITISGGTVDNVQFDFPFYYK